MFSRRKRAPEGIKKGTPSGHEDSRKVPQAYKILVVMKISIFYSEQFDRKIAMVMQAVQDNTNSKHDRMGNRTTSMSKEQKTVPEFHFKLPPVQAATSGNLKSTITG